MILFDNKCGFVLGENPKAPNPYVTWQFNEHAELWDRVDAEYDEKIAANEPDMTFELKEVDLEVCERSR